MRPCEPRAQQAIDAHLDAVREQLIRAGAEAHQASMVREAVQERLQLTLAAAGVGVATLEEVELLLQAEQAALETDRRSDRRDAATRQALGPIGLGLVVAAPILWVITAAVSDRAGVSGREVGRTVLLTTSVLGTLLGWSATPSRWARLALWIGGGMASATLLWLLGDVWSQMR